MIKTICYGKEKNFTTTKEAILFYMDCYYGSDPGSSENDRYSTILAQLIAGETYCTDEV